jgi:hypothetical protein
VPTGREHAVRSDRVNLRLVPLSVKAFLGDAINKQCRAVWEEYRSMDSKGVAAADGGIAASAGVGHRKSCRITAGEPSSKGAIAVRSYRSVLNAYANNAESKFDGPDGKQCSSWARGILRRTHIIAGEHRYCGKEFKRKLEQGPVDHEDELKCKVYENGRVIAGPETLRQLTSFSERQIRDGTGVRRDTIRLIRHGKGVKHSTYEKVINFLRENARPASQA